MSGRREDRPPPVRTTTNVPPEAAQRADAGRLGMVLFLIALGVLFAASMVAFLVVRFRAEDWVPTGAHRLPRSLWISTLILLVSSLTMHLGLSSARRDRGAATARWVVITLVLGIGFLLSQVLSWIHLMAADVAAGSSMYAFTFYMLTGLHGAHVLGGLIPLGISAWRAGQGRYLEGRTSGVRNVAMYWHFLDGVWIVMYMVMLIAI